MEIKYLGHSSFRIKSKEAIIVTDPFSNKDPKLGLKFPKVEADIVTVSHSHHDHNAVSSISGNPFIINAPGEYEVKRVNIFGYSTYHGAQAEKEREKNIAFLIESEDLIFGHLGDLGHLLEDELLEELSKVDILCIPVGGTYTLDGEKAAEVVKQIDPSIVIPMHFKVPNLAFELEPVEKFIQAMEVDSPEKLDKLKVNKDTLPEETKVIILEAAS